MNIKDAARGVSERLLAMFVPGKEGKIAVWGGGGTLNMIKQVLPQAVYFSARTGRPREPGHEQITEFAALVWAAPRSADVIFPPESLNFKEVIDLNYQENSPGLEFAQRAQIRYTSGIKMFDAQAEAQQRYWQENER